MITYVWPVFSEVTYSFEISTVDWPSQTHADEAIETYGDSAPEVRDANDTNAAVRANFVNAEVYFQEFNYETVTERPAYVASLNTFFLRTLKVLWSYFLFIFTVFLFI